MRCIESLRCPGAGGRFAIYPSIDNSVSWEIDLYIMLILDVTCPSAARAEEARRWENHSTGSRGRCETASRPSSSVKLIPIRRSGQITPSPASDLNWHQRGPRTIIYSIVPSGPKRSVHSHVHSLEEGSAPSVPSYSPPRGNSADGWLDNLKGGVTLSSLRIR